MASDFLDVVPRGACFSRIVAGSTLIKLLLGIYSSISGFLIIKGSELDLL